MDETGKKLAAGITQREDGTIAIRVTCQIDGQRRASRLVLAKGASLDEAITARERLRRELTGEVEVAPPPITLSDYAVGWLAGKAERLRPRVIEIYTTTLAHHILPQLGEVELKSLTRRHIEGWVAYAEGARLEDGSPYSRYTVAEWWRRLVQVVRDAVADHGLPRDPTERVQPPRIQSAPKRETRTLSREQLGALVRAAEEWLPEWSAQITTLAYTGIRAGELYGLRWEDVDDAASCLHIRQSASHGHITPPKGGASRIVYAPSLVLEAIAAHRRRMIEEQHPGLASGLVFPSQVGTARDANALSKPLAIASVDAQLDLRVTPQVLRRTYNTLLMADGADRIVLRAQMGHTSEAMTQRYSGVALELKAKVVGRVFGGDV